MKLSVIALVMLFASSRIRADMGMSEQQMKFYSEAAMKAEQAAQKAKREALAAATFYEQVAEIRVKQKMDADPQHKAASDTLATATRVLNEARQLNNPQLQVAASSQFNQADQSLKQMEAVAIASDVDVQAAKAILARLDDPQQQPQPIPPGVIAVASTPPPPNPGQDLTNPGTSPVPFNAGPDKPDARKTKAKKKRPTMIEIGMTRDDLLAFVGGNSHYKVVRFAADKPVSTIDRDTVIHRQVSGSANIVGTGTVSSGSAVGSANTTVAEQEHTTIKRDKSEYVVIQILEAQQVVTSVKRAAFGGGTETETEPRLMPAGTMTVTLTDDVVSAVGAADNGAPYGNGHTR